MTTTPKWPHKPEQNELWSRDGKLVKILWVRASNVEVRDLQTGKVRVVDRKVFEQCYRFERGGRRPEQIA